MTNIQATADTRLRDWQSGYATAAKIVQIGHAHGVSAAELEAALKAEMSVDQFAKRVNTGASMGTDAVDSGASTSTDPAQNLEDNPMVASARRMAQRAAKHR